MDSQLSFQNHLNLEDTELRLGLPGIDGSADSSCGVRTNKRNLQNHSAPPPKYVPCFDFDSCYGFWGSVLILNLGFVGLRLLGGRRLDPLGKILCFPRKQRQPRRRRAEGFM